MDITELKMRDSHIIETASIPDGFEVTLCKASRRGRKAKGLSAQHKPHKHRVSWDAAEALAPGASTDARLGGSEEA